MRPRKLSENKSKKIENCAKKNPLKDKQCYEDTFARREFKIWMKKSPLKGDAVKNGSEEKNKTICCEARTLQKRINNML